MLVGHVAVGLAGKRFVPGISLGTLVLAAVAADLLWCLFLMVGLERVEIRAAGPTLMKSVVISEVPYSHSLLMDGLWASVFALAYFRVRRSARGAGVVAGAVLSHWVLDFASHHRDMPLAPGLDRVYGLGLWNSLPATVAVEGGFWLGAVVLYSRSMRAKTPAGRYGFWIGVVVLTSAWRGNVAGPPPRDLVAARITSLIFFALVVAWASWMNRLRPVPA